MKYVFCSPDEYRDQILRDDIARVSLRSFLPPKTVLEWDVEDVEHAEAVTVAEFLFTRHIRDALIKVL